MISDNFVAFISSNVSTSRYIQSTVSIKTSKSSIWLDLFDPFDSFSCPDSSIVVPPVLREDKQRYIWASLSTISITPSFWVLHMLFSIVMNSNSMKENRVLTRIDITRQYPYWSIRRRVVLILSKEDPSYHKKQNDARCTWLWDTTLGFTYETASLSSSVRSSYSIYELFVQTS